MAIARRLDRPTLIDHVPEVLERIGDLTEELTRSRRASTSASTASSTSSNSRTSTLEVTASRYALGRLAHGFDVGEVVRELSVLRECIMTHVHPSPVASRQIWELRSLHVAIDRTICEAVDDYVGGRDRALRNLQRVATAALTIRKLDELLKRLLELLQDATPTIDAGVVFLRDGDQIRVRASIGLAPDPTGFSMPLGEGVAGRAASSGRPHTERAADLDRGASPILRRPDIRALCAVPLLEEDRVIAVIEIGSSSTDTLSEADQLLVNVMANRVDLAIHQHMLRETAELRAAEMEAVIESIPEAVVIGTHDQVRYNRAALEVPEPMHARDVETGAPLPPEETPFSKALRGETTTREVLVSRPGTGEDVVMRTSAAPIQTHGRLIGAVSVSADITEAKRAAEAQRASLGHLQALLDYAPAAVFIRDLEGRFVLVNRTYGEIFGIDPALAPGKTVRELRPDACASLLEAIAANDRTVIETRKPIQREEVCTLHGERRIYLSFIFPLGDAAGRLYAVCGISTEITDRKRVEEARERVIAILGHDLRDPVNAIILAAKMLEAPELGEEARLKIVHRIGRSGQRMGRMIAELLDFTRGHLGGGIPIAPKPTDLGAICADVTDELLTAHPDVRLELCQTGELTGWWDKERLAQVVSNLVGNAVKHRVRGSPIRLDVAGAKDEVVLIVKNTASGRLPEEQLARIFDAFRGVEQRRTAATEAGLGLGLYIAREIVRAHGGSIHATSGADCSFSVVVRLPRRRGVG